MNQIEFRRQVRNWQRAYTYFRMTGRCFSLEGQWRSPQRWEDPTMTTEGAIDFLDAWRVELAWRACSKRSRWVLKYHYHDKFEPRLASRLIRKFAGLHLRLNEWREYLRVARHELAVNLGYTSMKHAIKQQLQLAA
jgi:hypothetical protein